MERLSNWLLAGVLAITFFVACTAPAEGANTPDYRLDSIASRYVGKPVSVWCENNNEAWDTLVQGASQGKLRGSAVGGYAYPNGNQLWLSPANCGALLRSLNDGYLHAGLRPLSDGLMTLLHEAQHLRGTVNEGETDCAALRAFRGYLDDVGVPATVVKPVKVAGKFVSKRVVNPYFTRMVQLAGIIHATRPSPEYRRAC